MSFYNGNMYKVKLKKIKAPPLVTGFIKDPFQAHFYSKPLKNPFQFYGFKG